MGLETRLTPASNEQARLPPLAFGERTGDFARLSRVETSLKNGSLSAFFELLRYFERNWSPEYTFIPAAARKLIFAIGDRNAPSLLANDFVHSLAKRACSVIGDNLPFSEVKVGTAFVRALSRLNVDDKLIFDSISNEVQNNAKVSSLVAAKLLGAFGHLNRGDESLASILVNSVISDFDALNPHRITDALLGSFVIGNKDLFKAVWDQCVSKADITKFNLGEIRLLYWISIAADVRQNIPTSWKNFIAIALRDVEKDRPNVNGFEHCVYNILRRLNIEAQPQVYIGGCWVDIVATINGKVCIVECDGAPFHYVDRDPTNRLLGREVVRSQFLKRSGYEVLRIVGDHLAHSSETMQYVYNILNRTSTKANTDSMLPGSMLAED